MFTNVEEELDFYIENEEDILNGKEIEDIDEMKTYDLMKEKCTDCNINRIVILEDNNLVCPSCGKCVSMNYFCLSYEESQNIKKTYLYKRVTHFLHWIKLIQGINHVSLKEEEKNNIITMMEDKRDVKSLKLVLKKLKLNKYYKFSYFILNKLFDVELLKLSPYIEYKLKCLFEQEKKKQFYFISVCTR